MQIVINISDEVWNKAKEYGHLDICGIELSKKVINGIPLPKGHGRLVDEKDLSLMTVHLINGMLVCDAPTIVEADIENKREEKEPKYCDRNICMLNEYKGIECDKCEVMAERNDYIYTGY